jgi:hypothetical protein
VAKLAPETLPEQALTSLTPAIELARPATYDVKIRQQLAFSYQGLSLVVLLTPCPSMQLSLAGGQHPPSSSKRASTLSVPPFDLGHD